MPERTDGPRREVRNGFESRVEHAETVAEMLMLVGEVLRSEGYVQKGEGWEKIALANRVGIQRFGRKAYYDAFEDAYGGAEIYMRPPDE